MTKSRATRDDGYITRASWRRPVTAQRARARGLHDGRKVTEQRQVNGKKLLSA